MLLIQVKTVTKSKILTEKHYFWTCPNKNEINSFMFSRFENLCIIIRNVINNKYDLAGKIKTC